MADKIQKFDDIAPLDQSQQAEVDTPAQAEYEEGKALLERGETAAAAVALHNALMGFEEKNNDKGIANASTQLGLACIQRGDHEKAIGHLQRAEEICNNLGDPMSLVWLSKHFIVVYTATERYKEAIDRCLDLLDYYKANNDPRATVEILEKMAEVYLESDDTSKAADAFETIASIHRNYRHTKIAQSYVEKAEELRQKG